MLRRELTWRRRLEKRLSKSPIGCRNRSLTHRPIDRKVICLEEDDFEAKIPSNEANEELEIFVASRMSQVQKFSSSEKSLGEQKRQLRIKIRSMNFDGRVWTPPPGRLPRPQDSPHNSGTMELQQQQQNNNNNNDNGPGRSNNNNNNKTSENDFDVDFETTSTATTTAEHQEGPIL